MEKIVAVAMITRRLLLEEPDTVGTSVCWHLLHLDRFVKNIAAWSHIFYLLKDPFTVFTAVHVVLAN